jgi:hypothetical protein
MSELPRVYLSNEDIAPVMKALEALADMADKTDEMGSIGVTAEVTLTIPNVAMITWKR